MLIKLGKDSYLNLDNVVKLIINEDGVSYKVLAIGIDGKICSTDYLFKNDEEDMINYARLLEIIKLNTANSIEEPTYGRHYVNDEDYTLLQAYKERKDIELEFNYKDGMVRRYKSGKTTYVEGNVERDISKEQYTLYYNVMKDGLNE